MGYYSFFTFSILEKAQVDMRKKKEVEDFFLNKDNEGIYGFYGVKLETTKDGMLKNIEVEDDNNKFYDSRLFAQELAGVLIEGSIILHFAGEDGAFWGFLVEAGAVRELIPVYVTEQELEKIKPLLSGIRIVPT